MGVSAPGGGEDDRGRPSERGNRPVSESLAVSDISSAWDQEDV
ncbi:hypothetical protein [Streptomyces sp. SAS_270]